MKDLFFGVAVAATFAAVALLYRNVQHRSRTVLMIGLACLALAGACMIAALAEIAA